MTWGELIASIVANTSMTPKDIDDMSYPALEELLEGMEKNAKKMKDELDGKKRGNAQDLLARIAEKGDF